MPEANLACVQSVGIALELALDGGVQSVDQLDQIEDKIYLFIFACQSRAAGSGYNSKHLRIIIWT